MLTKTERSRAISFSQELRSHGSYACATMPQPPSTDPVDNIFMVKCHKLKRYCFQNYDFKYVMC